MENNISFPTQIATFVVHVKGNELREKHIQSELGKFGIPFEFILRGNISDLNQEILDQYFIGDFKAPTAMVSCTLKHILSYEAFLKTDKEYALIFEDDIHLYSNFNSSMKSVLKEIESRNLNSFLISLEDSFLKYIPRSKRVKGQSLYKMPFGRMAGAYLIDRKFAEKAVDYVKNFKCHIISDWFHNHLQSQNIIEIYWLQAPNCCQGSLNGKIASIIDNKRTGYLETWVFRISRFYKRLLYKLR